MAARMIVALLAASAWLLGATLAQAAEQKKTPPKTTSGKPWGGTPPPNPAQHKSGQPYARPKGNVSTSNQVLDYKGGKTSRPASTPAKPAITSKPTSGAKPAASKPVPSTIRTSTGSGWGSSTAKPGGQPAKSGFSPKAAEAARKIGAKSSTSSQAAPKAGDAAKKLGAKELGGQKSGGAKFGEAAKKFGSKEMGGHQGSPSHGARGASGSSGQTHRATSGPSSTHQSTSGQQGQKPASGHGGAATWGGATTHKDATPQRGLGGAAHKATTTSPGSQGAGTKGFSDAARKVGAKAGAGTPSQPSRESGVTKAVLDKREADLEQKIREKKHQVDADEQNIKDAQKQKKDVNQNYRENVQGIISGRGEQMSGQEADDKTYKFKGQDRGAAPMKAVGTEMWQSQQERDANIKGINEFEQRMKDKRDADKADLERYQRDLEKLRKQRTPPVQASPPPSTPPRPQQPAPPKPYI
ncbi:MAG: hypothetical protein HY910_10425 [Desulfarculus sp.]|nr:hypothetical protein [Desulfarculus sp.]